MLSPVHAQVTLDTWAAATADHGPEQTAANKSYKLTLGGNLTLPLRLHGPNGNESRALTYNLANRRLEFSLDADASDFRTTRVFCLDLDQDNPGVAGLRLQARDIDENVVIDSALGQALSYKFSDTRFQTVLAASARCFAYLGSEGVEPTFSMLGSSSLPAPRLYADRFESTPGLTISFLSAEAGSTRPLRSVARRSEGEGSGEFRYRLRLSNKGSMDVDGLSLQLLEMFNSELFPARFDATLDSVSVECVSSGGGASCGQIFTATNGPQPLRARNLKLPAKTYVDFFLTRRIDTDSMLGRRIVLDAGTATLQTFRGQTIFAAASHEIVLIGDGTWIAADNPPHSVVVSQSLEQSYHTVEVQAWETDPNEVCTVTTSDCSIPLQGLEISLDEVCRIQPSSRGTSTCQPVDLQRLSFDATAVTDADGVASFRVASELAGTLQANFSVVDSSLNALSSDGLRADQLQTSAQLLFDPAPPAALRYLTVQTQGQAGVDLGVQIEVIDQFQNRVGCDSENEVTVTLSLLQTLASGGPVLAVEGQSFDCGLISFDKVAINRSGSGYELRASAPGYTPINSAPISIESGQPHQLRFEVQPQQSEAGQVITPAVVVHIEDQFGNLTNSNADVAMNLAIDPTDEASLSGGGPVEANSGVATFPALSINRSGSGFLLGATALGLDTAFSQPFEITPSAPAAIELTGPSSQTAGEHGGDFTLTVVDQFNNPTIVPFDYSFSLSSSSSGSWSFLPTGPISIGAGSSSATFTYSDTRADTATVSASYASGPVDLGTANHEVTILAAEPNQLGFVTQPANAEAGQVFPSAVEVEVLDEFNNRVGSDNLTEITLALLDSADDPITLDGTLAVSANAGLATFNNLSTTAAGTGYRLTAAAAGLAGADSDDFDVASAQGIALQFLSIPDQLVSGLALDPPLQVAVIDNFGNIATDDTRNITLRISDGNSSQGLGTPLAAESGVASFTAPIPANWSGQGLAFEAIASPLFLISDPVDVSKAAFTFSDFDGITADIVSQASVGVDASASNLSGSTLVRYRITLRDGDGDGVEGFVFTYCADGPDCNVSETLLPTNGSGQAFFGPEDGISASVAGITDSGGSTSLFEFELGSAGEYSLKVELLEVDASDSSQLEWLGQGEITFSVVD